MTLLRSKTVANAGRKIAVARFVGTGWLVVCGLTVCCESKGSQEELCPEVFTDCGVVRFCGTSAEIDEY